MLDIYRDWSPLGTDRFMELVHDNFFTNIALFRCVEHFLTQFGISDIPEKKVFIYLSLLFALCTYSIM